MCVTPTSYIRALQRNRFLRVNYCMAPPPTSGSGGGGGGGSTSELGVLVRL